MKRRLLWIIFIGYFFITQVYRFAGEKCDKRTQNSARQNVGGVMDVQIKPWKRYKNREYKSRYAEAPIAYKQHHRRLERG